MSQNPADTLTLIIAVYGAILATLSFVLSIILAIHEITRQRPKIKVKVTSARIYFKNDVINKALPSELLIAIQAVNIGIGPIKLTGFGFILKNENKIQFINSRQHDMPTKLDERSICSNYISCKWFRENKQNNLIVKAFYQSETGEQWEGKISRKQKHLWMNSQDDGVKVKWNPNSKSYEPLFEE